MKDFKPNRKMHDGPPTNMCWGGKAMKKAKGGYAEGGMRSENTEYAKSRRDMLDTYRKSKDDPEYGVSQQDYRQGLAARRKAQRDLPDKEKDSINKSIETGYDYRNFDDFEHNLDRLSRSPTTDSDGNMKYKKGGMAKGGKNWIAGAIKHKGALHRDLGVPMGKKIPAGKLAKAEHSSNPTIAKRARLAKTLASFK